MMVRILAAMAAALQAQAMAAPIEFHDVTEQSGLTARHSSGATGEYFYPEVAGSGVLWLDFDGDGDLDLYAVNSGSLYQREPGGKNHLLLNEESRFVEADSSWGVQDDGYGTGVCAADINGDGIGDLLVTNFGADRLFISRGNATFSEEAAARGVISPGWSTGCAFGDIDLDGDLDLYIANYVHFSLEQPKRCAYPGEKHESAHCTPADFRGARDSLFINDGNGVFTEQSAARGIITKNDALEKGFGVAMADIDEDGDLDIYVANDGTPNRLYVNDGKGNFGDQALLAGLAYNANGIAEAGMGVALEDMDNDLLVDIAVTNFAMELNAFYRNSGDGLFEYGTHRLGLGRSSYRMVGWGIVAADFDSDGDKDLAIANGHVQQGIEEHEPLLTYKQTNEIFSQEGDGRFVAADSAFSSPPHYSSRGLAAGDFDNDGRVDLAVNNVDGPVQIFRNTSPKARWIGVQLVGAATNTMAIGAKVAVRCGEHVQTSSVMAGGSYLSQSDPRLNFGLPCATSQIELTIDWPDGTSRTMTTSTTNRYIRVDKSAMPADL